MRGRGGLDSDPDPEPSFAHQLGSCSPVDRHRSELIVTAGCLSSEHPLGHRAKLRPSVDTSRVAGGVAAPILQSDVLGTADGTVSGQQYRPAIQEQRAARNRAPVELPARVPRLLGGVRLGLGWGGGPAIQQVLSHLRHVQGGNHRNPGDQ